ncbi:MAG: hypothetical protein A2W91_04585 [Bacteroidetes bacterium GWF2_38_335]|nr:MAG: hypothetical protein A2W91_04585 [Bacteroidetes bacterium GWF2_38_335]HBS88215.1 hypothetical protein [Bacteroidales bacterium]
MKKFNFSQVNYPLLIIILVYCTFFCLVSLVNHYNFRTYAWDLGINNNALFDYSHFRWNDNMVMQPQFDNVLSDHFSLIPLLVSPLAWIFGSYTMLLVQIAGILFGGFGVYRLIKAMTGNETYSLLAIIHFFSLWGVYSALSFDYHDNVMAAMFVPWFILFFREEKWKWATFYFVLILISKENMAFWAIFISIGLLVLHYREKTKIKASLLYSATAFAYFVFILKVVIPALSNENREYLHFHYDALGKTMGEALQTIFERPRYAFSLLFENQLKDPLFNGQKTELHFVILLSGGVALFYKPQYLLMLIPIFAQKLFSNDPGKWGISSHYSIEFVPIMTIALFHWIYTMKFNYKKYLAIGMTVLTIGTTVSFLEYRVALWYQPEFSAFYQQKHYLTDYDVEKVYDALEKIPDNAKVSAQGMIVPHMCFRDYIYQWPVVEDAEYVILIPEDKRRFPLNEKQYKQFLGWYKYSPDWEVFFEDEVVLILKRK